ncbi:hypothetical protein EVAR_9232_1 [Eumeta japonica]|uniref:Uncharacterized protein n=1 Tax=Eumeta variegata TaxID=151549 RepID=A0A4C2AEG5_EUMVA|nr:hypothetical protein EVAR_9232_1 [Eumeta japonica]
MAVSHACLTHSVYRSTTQSRSHESTTSTVPAVRALLPSRYQTLLGTPTTEPSLCCDSCALEGFRSGPPRRAELHAVTSTVLRKRRSPVYFERGDIPSVEYM